MAASTVSSSFDDETGEIATIEHQLPQLYEPQAGVENIRKLEALETYYRRAKDIEGLYQAVEAKLGEQRRFVVWWDLQEKSDAVRKMRASQTGDAQPELKDYDLTRMTVLRWRTKLKDPTKFDATLEAVQERCRRQCEGEKGGTDQKGASGTGENEWYTPDSILALARTVLGEIDLDAASSEAAQKIVQAKNYFTKADNAIEQEWHGNVWLNPPYAQPFIADFATKMVEEYLSERVNSAIMLTHNYTDTAWFQLLAGTAEAICFTRGRVKFYDANGIIAAPTQGQALFYFGADVTKFADSFKTIGFVVVPL